MYDFWDSLDNRTTGQQVSSITVAISAIYKNGDKKDIPNYRTISFFKFRQQNLHYNYQKWYAKTLDAIIDENQSAAIIKRTILQTLFIICDSIDLLNTHNKTLAASLMSFIHTTH